MGVKSNAFLRPTVFVLLLLIGAFFVVVDTDTVVAASEDGYIYTVSGEDATIIGYTGAGGSITIPSTLGGCYVVAIGWGAFYSCTALTSVTIPDSVNSIGERAFLRCTALTSVTIPDSVTTIGIGAFASCTSLTGIDVSPDNSHYASLNGALYNITMNELLQYPAGKIGEFTIPDSVASIGDWAFRDCTALTSVTIPDSVASIGDVAFESCTALTSVSIGSEVTFVGGYAFISCTSLTSVTIPDGVTTIGNYAFSRCTALTSVTIGNGVTTIGGAVFSYCTSLTSVTIPDSVASIGDVAFESCTALTSVTIGNGVTTIGGSVFSYCTSLTSVTIGNGVTTIGDYAFRSCTSLTSVTIPNSVARIGNAAFYSCTSLTSVTIPNSVTTIGIGPFASCTSLTGIDVSPDNSHYASLNGALYNITMNELLQYPAGKIGEFTIPDSVTNIGDGAFYSCTSLTSVIIPNSVISIEYHAFNSCTSLTSVIIPNSVTTIGDYAFFNCTSLASMTIPDSVTTIGEGAFNSCTSLNSIAFFGLDAPTVVSPYWIQYTPSTLRGHAYAASNFPAPGTDFFGLTMGSYIVEDYTFTVSEGNATITGYTGTGGVITIPSILGGYPTMAIGDNAFAQCANLTSVTIPNSVISVGNQAFVACTSLNSMTIPNSVTFIGYEAFVQCVSLTSIEIPSSVITMGAHPFAVCTSLISIAVDAGNPFFASINGVLYNKAITTLIQYPGGKMGAFAIPSSVTYIAGYSFLGCVNLTSVTIPNSVISIGSWAFYYYCTSLVTIDVDPGNLNYASVDGVLYDKGITTLMQYPCGKVGPFTIPNSVTSIENWAFARAFTHCTSMISVVIPNSVTSIGNYAFFESYLTSVTIGNGITSITEQAFSYCPLLESVTIGRGVTSIENRAFFSSASLTSITFLGTVAPTAVDVNWILDTPATISGHVYAASNFPAPGGVWNGLTMGEYIPTSEDYQYTVSEGVATITGYIGTGGSISIPAILDGYPTRFIGFSAFGSCTSLTSVTIPNSVISIGTQAFISCTSLVSAIIPESVVTIEMNAFLGCTALTTVTIPNSVTFLGSNAFSDCTSLTSVIIGSGLSTLSSAFSYCTALASISIPSSVTSIGGYAFTNCTALASVSIPNSVTSIGTYAFAYCTALASVMIPNSVTTIEYAVFAGCTALASVMIPNSVTTIEYAVFAGCTSLPAIDIDTGNLNYASLEGVLYNKVVTELIQYPAGKAGAFVIPSSVIAIADDAFNYCTSLTSITIPDSVTTIGGAAFGGCTALTSIKIPDSVTSIGSYAFAYCSALTSASLGGGIIRIEYYIFEYCTSLTSVTIPDSVTVISPGAFYSCTSLTSVTIPDSVTAFQSGPAYGAFQSCTSLTSIIFLGAVAPSIGDVSWIQGTPAMIRGHAYAASDFPATGSLWNGLMMGAVIPASEDYTYTVSSGMATITGYTGVGGDITIPSTLGGYLVVAIENWAFTNNTALTSVTIPNSVTSIGYSAFSSCTSLISVTMPTGVTTIGGRAFVECTSLTSMTIGSGVTSIGYQALAWCTSLTAIAVSTSNSYYANNAGDGVLYDKTLTTLIQCPGGKVGVFAIPNSVISIGEWAFFYCTALTSVTIPSSVTSIGSGAFVCCTALTSVTIPSSVTTIGNSAFHACAVLTSIAVSASNSYYANNAGDGVLYDKTLTTLIQYPAGNARTSFTVIGSVTSFGDYAFYCSNALTSVTIPNSVTSIGFGTFYCCANLTSVTIPNSVTSIGDWAFRDCTSLTTIAFLGSVAPTAIGADWITSTPAELRGHAYAASNFPVPGDVWNGLTMGEAISGVPGNPIDLSATPGNAQVTLAWTAPINDGGSPITGYKVYRSTIEMGTYVLINSPSDTNYTDVGLIIGQAYWYKTTAVNAAGEGEYSSYVSSTPFTIPAAPTGLTATGGNNQVTLTWVAPITDGGSAIDYYIVYANGSALAIHPTGLSATITGLTNGLNYSFTVAAHNAAGLGAQTDIVSSIPYRQTDVLPPVEAVILSTGLAAAGAAMASQAVAGASSAAPGSFAAWVESFWALLNRIFNFCFGFVRGRLASLAFKLLNKVEPEKGTLVERESFIAGFSVRELGVIAFTSAVLGITFLMANKMEVLQPSNLLLYILVAGFALTLHDLAHRYVAWKYHAASEYQVWWLGAVIMFLTAGLFSVVYAMPARLRIEKADMLTQRQKMFIYGVGPLVSFLLFLAFALLLPLGGLMWTIGLLACSMNLLTATYSMMPFKPMDGEKVRKWSARVWLLAFLPLLVLYFVMMVYVF